MVCASVCMRARACVCVYMRVHILPTTRMCVFLSCGYTVFFFLQNTCENIVYIKYGVYAHGTCAHVSNAMQLCLCARLVTFCSLKHRVRC